MPLIPTLRRVLSRLDPTLATVETDIERARAIWHVASVLLQAASVVAGVVDPPLGAALAAALAIGNGLDALLASVEAGLHAAPQDVQASAQQLQAHALASIVQAAPLVTIQPRTAAPG